MEEWRFTVSHTRTGETWTHETDADSLAEAASAFLAHSQALAAAAALEALHSEIRAYMATQPARDRYRAYYRKLRSAGWLAQFAYRAARNHVALSYAEGTGQARFDWLPDSDYEPYDDDAEFLAQEIAKLRSGEWEALGCVLATPASDHAASLWGIVIGSSGQDDLYRRDVETDLAYEAGILPDNC